MDETLASHSKIKASIKSILVKVLQLEIDPDQLGDHEPLFAGLEEIDSVAAIEILAEMEEVFDIYVEDEALNEHVFTNVETLATLVEASMQKHPPPKSPDHPG
jgi:acyl carrier protein